MPSLDFQSMGTVFVGLVVISQWIWAWQKNRREESDRYEQRHTPAIHERYATKTELANLEKNLGEAISQLSNRITRGEDLGAQSRDKIYTRLTELQSEVASLRKENELSHQAMNQLSTKIDRLIERESSK